MSYVVTMGQAFDSKRSESFDTMQQVLQSTPDLIHMIGDIFFAQLGSGWRGSVGRTVQEGRHGASC
jgi:hypothetical protein